MESLMELVAASFARHGIECRDSNVGADAVVRSAERSSATDSQFDSNQAALPQEPALKSALPDHNYMQGDPAP
jgi:hypothetical protein